MRTAVGTKSAQMTHRACGATLGAHNDARAQCHAQTKASILCRSMQSARPRSGPSHLLARGCLIGSQDGTRLLTRQAARLLRPTPGPVARPHHPRCSIQLLLGPQLVQVLLVLVELRPQHLLEGDAACCAARSVDGLDDGDGLRRQLALVGSWRPWLVVRVVRSKHLQKVHSRTQRAGGLP